MFYDDKTRGFVLGDLKTIKGDGTTWIEWDGLMQGKPRGRCVMSHDHEGGQARDQANSERQTGVAAHARTIRCEVTYHVL